MWWYFEEAMTVSKRGLALFTPTSKLSNMAYEGSLILAGRPEEAIEVSLAYVKKHPGNLKALADAGRCLLGCGSTG